jgi:thiamine pyrophosphokinase
VKNKIVDSLEPITLLGGGEVGADDLRLALQVAPVCVAADGGAVRAQEAGCTLAAVIGDMDSISEQALAQIPKQKIHLIEDQVTTDFDKALRSIAAPAVVAVGFTGGRIDHQLSAYHTLVARAEIPCVVLGENELVFHCPPDLTLPTREGEVVSLFPMAHVTGQSEGLIWQIDGLAFDPARFIGTSNRATGPMRLRMYQRGMLVIVPRRLIQPVVSQLAIAGRWPALS